MRVASLIVVIPAIGSRCLAPDDKLQRESITTCAEIIAAADMGPSFRGDDSTARTPGMTHYPHGEERRRRVSNHEDRVAHPSRRRAFQLPCWPLASLASTARLLRMRAENGDRFPDHIFCFALRSIAYANTAQKLIPAPSRALMFALSRSIGGTSRGVFEVRTGSGGCEDGA
jgi:hypothetical protein